MRKICLALLPFLAFFLVLFMFGWITGGEFNASPQDLWYNFNDFVDYNWQYGDERRVGAFWVIVHIILDIAILAYLVVGYIKLWMRRR